MLTLKQMVSLGRRHKRYLEGVIYLECMTHGIKKVPRLEIAEDKDVYYNGKRGVIHIGVAGIEAETEKDFFDQVFFLLGHELQHMLSTTQKDWEAAQQLCFREACQRLSVKTFGRARRLTKDSDYEAFFKDLADKDIYVNKRMLMNYAHLCLNAIEDGRIENLRQVKHPGFGIYRKLWNGKAWLKMDLETAPFFKEDVNDLDPFGELAIIMTNILTLSLHGVYQKGFLKAYEGTKLHKKIAGFIPDISKGVLSKTCKGCMDSARMVFNRLLDLLLEVCTCEMTAKEIEKLLKDLLDKLMNEAENADLSATPNTEETGDGIPSESLFGTSELEVELTKEEFDELMENVDEEDLGGMAVKVKVAEETSDEAEETEETSSSDGGTSMEDAESEENSPTAESNNGSKDGDENSGDGTGETEKAGDKAEMSDSATDESADSESEGEDGSPSDSPSDNADGKTGESEMDKSSENESGFNNRVEGCEQSGKDEDIESQIQEAMEDAAKNPTGDFEIAEADAKLDEEFKEAASKFRAVEPGAFDAEAVDSSYAYDVEFTEKTRAYAPTGRLPLELENKGKSLDRTIDQLIKNKVDPDQRFLRSGKLDTRRLANLALGDINIFKKNGEPVKTDVAGFLLMDNSGSMGNGPGSTRFACCNAFAVLEEGFKRHMALKIAAFDAHGNERVMHEVIKEFDEVIDANLSFNFRDLGRDGYGNKDGYSIRVATQQLLQRSEKEKILIIASDGWPTDYRGGFNEGIADVKAAVEDARKMGIRTIGMYMYHDQNDEDFAVFTDMYGPEIIFASLDEIEDELVRILKRYF